jgi:hypothetical protein
MNTDTPRTDEVAWPETGLVEGDFARQLERELTAVQIWIAKAHYDIDCLKEQRDRLAEAIRKHKFDDVKLWQALQSLNQPTEL